MPNPPSVMSFIRALNLLILVHTREDYGIGFTVAMGAMPDHWSPCSNEEYVEAWRVVRRAMGMPT